jgi:hypothetical protein
MAVGSSFAREVPINPITPDIRAKLKESTELIGKVEDKLAPRVKEMEKVFRTYRETCKGGGNDRGCVEIQNQLRQRYREVLTDMSEKLPKVRETVHAAARDLGQSIRSKTQRKDLKELLEEVSKKGALPKIRGPLSKKLSELLQAMGSNTANVSVLELSLRMQADLIAAIEYLDFLDARMSHQMVLVDMVQDFGVLSPEMASVMKGVSDLFGYDAGFDLPVEEEQKSATADWRD